MTQWKVSFSVPQEAANTFAGVLEDCTAPQALAVSICEDNPSSYWRVEALYEEAPEVQDIHWIVTPAKVHTSVHNIEITVEALPETDWVRKSLEGLAPVHAGRFFVYGAHDTDKLPPSSISILVEAGEAFGTGHHATTHSCLEYISEILRTRPLRNALDLGTGTGILAIALGKMTRRNVLASDIDPIATRVARGNAKINGAAPFVTAVTAAGFNHPLLSARAPYDLIVANILARPLVTLAPGFHSRLEKGGILVLSGILRAQETMVTSACRAQGLYLVSRKTMGDWVTLKIEN